MKEYAAYKGEEFLGVGTAKELAKLVGCTENEIYVIKSRKYWERAKRPQNCYIIVEIEEDEIVTNLKIARKRKNISQWDLAEMLGISQSTLSKWERGVSQFTVRQLIEIAKILNVSTDYLLCLKEE